MLSLVRVSSERINVFDVGAKLKYGYDANKMTRVLHKLSYIHLDTCLSVTVMKNHEECHVRKKANF